MRILFAIGLVILVGIASTVGAAPVTLYSNDFNGNETFYSGVTGGLSGITGTEGVQGLSVLGFSGKLLRNISTGNPASATTLTLHNLPLHTFVDISFLFVFIDSWDSDHTCPN